MISFIKAIIILLFCIGASAMAIRFIDRQRNMTPHVVIWSVLTVVIFLTQSYPLVMAVLILVKIFYLKNDADKNISMFLSLMVVMPFSFLFKLVPGINLIDVAIIQMLTIVFFLPLVYRILRDDSFHLHHPDILAMALMALLLFNAFRVTTEYEFTWFQTVRDFIDTMLVVVIPYFVISRGLRRFASLDNALAGLLFGGLAMAFFSVFEEALQWRPYVEIGSIVGTMPDLESMYEYRGGFLRVTATLTGPITFGFYLTIVLAALMYFLRKNRVNTVMQAAAIGFFLMIMLFTGSRSALLGGLLYTALYVLFSLRRRLRRVLLLPVILAAMVGAIYSEAHSPGPKQTASLEQVDQYGTFEYRKRLFFTAIQVIPDHLWFGTRMYRGDYRMKKMVQGQGIIDMVNGFIHITIEYGLVALVLLVLLILRNYRVLSENIVDLADDEIGPSHDPWSEPALREETRVDGENDDEFDELPVMTARAQARNQVFFAQAFAPLLISICLQFSFTSYAATIIPLLWIMFALMRAYQLILMDIEEASLPETAVFAS